jgi:AraC family transcriptional regulator
MASSFAEMQSVLAYVASHLDDDVSLRVLAERAGLSTFYLHRVFASTIRETPKQTALRLRLGRAAVLLLTTRHSILDIALSCGFQSPEVFTRAFRRRFGMNPSAYRARGFVNQPGPGEALDHAALVERVGPCVTLYHLPTSFQEKNDMTYSISRKELEPQPVLVVRRVVKRSEIAATIGEVLPHIFQHAQQSGLALTGHPFTRYVSVGHGLLTIEPGMRIASGSPVPGHGQVIADTLPGGAVAATTHRGAYDTLSDAYGAIEQWMSAEGFVSAGAPWEAYVTDPGEYPDPKDWQTDVFWPIAR